MFFFSVYPLHFPLYKSPSPPLSPLPAFCLGATLALYQIELVQQLRPDVTKVEVGWSRWCLVASTGGFLLGALLNTCDSVKRNRLHREDVQKKAEVKGKMMAEMEARRRQAAAATLRGAGAGDGGKQPGGPKPGGGGGAADSNRNFKMTAQVAARAAAASIVGARERGDFKGKRLSIAVDAAVTNAMAQLNLHKSLAGSSSPNKTPAAKNSDNNSSTTTTKPSGSGPNSTSQTNDGVILVNEATGPGDARNSTSQGGRPVGNNSRLRATASTQPADPRDGGDDSTRSRYATDKRDSRESTALSTNAEQTRSLTTTTTSLHTTTTPTASSEMPSIENLRKSKLTKAGHVDSGQDLNRLARLPVLKEERAGNPTTTTTLDEKSKARLEEAQALRKRISDTSGFSSNQDPSRARGDVQSNQPRDIIGDGERTTLSSPIKTDRDKRVGDIAIKTNTDSSKTPSIPSSKCHVTDTDQSKNSSKDTMKRPNPQREPNTTERTEPISPKLDEISMPFNQGRRKSTLGDALLGVSNFISDTVSIAGDKTPSHTEKDARVPAADKNNGETRGKYSKDSANKTVPKSPSVLRRTRDSIESFSKEMGIDPLPPVASSNRSQISGIDRSQREERPENKTRRLSSLDKKDTEEKSPRTSSEDRHGDKEDDRRTSRPTRDGSKSQRSQDSSISNTARGEGNRVILPRLTSVESTSKAATVGDSKAVSSPVKGKPNGHIVKVGEIAPPAEDTNTDSSTAAVRKTDGNAVKATAPKAPVRSETVPAQLSQEEKKRRAVLESMVRVNRETKKKRITQ